VATHLIGKRTYEEFVKKWQLTNKPWWGEASAARNLFTQVQAQQLLFAV